MQKHFLKRLLCFALVMITVFSLTGCNSNLPQERYGLYYTAEGERITDVTLDVIAQAHYKKTFEKCNNSKRKDVLHKYFNYYSASYSLSEELIDAVFNMDIPWSNANALQKLQDAMSDQDSMLPFVHLYASAKNMDDLDKFADVLGNVTEVGGTAFQVTKTAALILDMSHNDISNPQAYCDSILNSLSALTEFLPVFDSYFTESLSVIQEGLTTLINNNENREKILGAYDELFDPNTSNFFTRITSTANYEFIAHPEQWDSSMAPTLADLALRKNDFPYMSDRELQYVEEYILYRLSKGLFTHEPPELIPPSIQDPNRVKAWYGYGNTSMASSNGTRFDLTVDSMNASSISGTLIRSYRYGIDHETKFTGSGRRVGGKIEYSIRFETSTFLGTIPTFEKTQIKLVYDTQSDTFQMDDFYEVTMNHISTRSLKPVSGVKNWSGLGKDSFYLANKQDNHLFQMVLTSLNESELTGNLTVSYNGKIDHETAFTGRGYAYSDKLYYEVLLETPRTENPIIEITIETFWLEYDRTKNTFRILGSGMYGVTMTPET